MPFRNAFLREGDTLFPPLHETKYYDRNPQEYLDKIIVKINEELRFMQGAPSVQMQYIPPDLQGWREEMDERLKEEEMEMDECKEERDGAGGLLARAGRRRREEERGREIRGELTVY
jgi:histone deacetylase HOS2